MRRLIEILISVISLMTAAIAHPAYAYHHEAPDFIDAQYSEAVVLFATMDNVSDWWTGFVEPAYREEWTARFGWSEEDHEWVDRYAEYRNRTYVDPTQGLDMGTSPDGLFASSSATSEATDPLATYMVGKRDIDAALDGLEAFASPTDAEMLLGFYRHFEPNWRALLIESKAVSQQAAKLEQDFNTERVRPFLDAVAAFYKVEDIGTFDIFFTRMPSGARIRAEVIAGNVLILHAPENLSYDAIGWDEIVAHEIVHHISSRQDTASKRAMTDRFLAICPVERNSRRLWVLEEPLAVSIGQAAYSKMVLGKELDPRSNWYANPWIDISARLIARRVIGALQKGVALEDTQIVEEAADRCATLTFISENM